MMSTEHPFPATITNDEAALLPLTHFPGEIVVVEDEEQVDAACDYLLRQRVIGFDTETRPTFRPGPMNRVALLQLATDERCYLFRLCKIRFDKAILKVLESPSVMKVGAAVAGDLDALQRLRRFRAGGFLDLQSIVGDWGIGEKSLRKLSAIVLGQRISKAQRLSNWEAASLTDKQRLYAATDAWISLRILRRLRQSAKTRAAAGA